MATLKGSDLTTEKVLELIQRDSYISAEDIAIHFGIPRGPQKLNQWFYKRLHARLNALELGKSIEGTHQLYPPRKYRRLP